MELQTIPTESKTYKDLKIPHDDFILVNYDKDSSYNIDLKKIVNGVDIEGCSGGGLWYVPSFSEDEQYRTGDKVDVYLIGIMSDWLKGKNYIKSVNIRKFLDKINEII